MKWFNMADSVNLISIIGSIIIFGSSALAAHLAFKQMQKAKNTDVELIPDTGDGIGKYFNAIPVGWSVMYIIFAVWGIWYWLFGYPLGSYSQIGEYNEEVEAHNALYADKFASLDDAQKIHMGEGVYLVHCAVCHGITADGIDGKAQDLTSWGSVSGIINTLKDGSSGLGFGEMPAGLLESEEEMKAVAQFILSDLSKAQSFSDTALTAKGGEIFAESCASCHGESGEGMEEVAPALNVYGTHKFVADVLNRGKKADADTGAKVIGVMPSFASTLSAEQKEAAGRYISSLGKDQ